MPDSVDMAVEIEAEHLARGLQLATRPIPAGVAGECDDCGEIMPRLVDGRCGFCRDGRVPPPGWMPPAIEPTIREEKAIMPESKSITFVATGAVLAEIKRRTADGTSNNRAALDLVEAAIVGAIPQAQAQAQAPAPAPAEPLDDDELIEQLRDRLGRVGKAAIDAAVAEVTTRAEAAESRATAAESRALAAEGRLERLKEALAA